MSTSGFLDFRLENRADKGMLVAFCGLDGSGKTTMIDRLARTRGANALVIQQPTELVRSLQLFRRFHDNPDKPRVDYRSLVLFTVGDRMLQTDEVIRPALGAGRSVISDRYIFCTLANMIARGYSSDRWIHEIIAHIPQPDLTVFMDVPVPIAEARIRARPEERDLHLDLDLMEKVRKAYTAICSAGFMRRIDSAACSADECFEQIETLIAQIEAPRSVHHG